MKRTRCIVILGTAALVAGCRTEHAPLERSLPPAAARSIDVRTTGIVAGEPGRATGMANPFEGNVHAIRDGKRLYAWFNCAGCHGTIGGGSIGPPLRDTDWIYGGGAGNVYQSIVQGRPQGMPAFGERLPEEQVWKLVAYVHAFGGAPSAEEAGSVASDPDKAQRGLPGEGSE